jgi:hypothetical protein
VGTRVDRGGLAGRLAEYIGTDHLVDNSCEKIDLSSTPHVVMQFMPAKTPDDIKAEILGATQRRLDKFAQTRGFDNILAAATYAASAVEQFALEGQRAAELRDATWAFTRCLPKCRRVVARCLQGSPTSSRNCPP